VLPEEALSMIVDDIEEKQGEDECLKKRDSSVSGKTNTDTGPPAQPNSPMRTGLKIEINEFIPQDSPTGRIFTPQNRGAQIFTPQSVNAPAFYPSYAENPEVGSRATVQRPRKVFSSKDDHSTYIQGFRVKYKTEICRNWEITGHCEFREYVSQVPFYFKLVLLRAR